MPAACCNHHRHPHVQAPPHLNAELKEPVGSANTTLNQVPCTRSFQQIASPHPLLRRKPVSVLFLHPPPMVAESGGIMRKSPGRDWKCCPGQARSSPAQPPLGVEKRLPSGDRWRLACPRAAPPPRTPSSTSPCTSSLPLSTTDPRLGPSDTSWGKPSCWGRPWKVGEQLAQCSSVDLHSKWVSRPAGLALPDPSPPTGVHPPPMHAQSRSVVSPVCS